MGRLGNCNRIPPACYPQCAELGMKRHSRPQSLRESIEWPRSSATRRMPFAQSAVNGVYALALDAIAPLHPCLIDCRGAVERSVGGWRRLADATRSLDLLASLTSEEVPW